MQSRTPADTGRSGAASELPLSTELASAVSGARRRAARDGDRQADTAHLLHTLLEADPATRRAFHGGPAQVARLLGYLVQRTIGYGLRWSGTVEDSAALPVLAGGRAAGWSPAASGAMRHARDRARARGAGRVEGLDLLAALVRDPRCRAVDVLRRAGVDTAALASVLAEHACPECR
ncbi:Clp protease N-terminal domain-containing protein [Streptomyces griseocarneus]|uniref:Clp protease N-terminal domain-containing protein n=1 Tax=Streptomyces griseocarneus TaxID=51201 RepID=UPI00167C5037|nr:Clp protease N-terminal domain-containing protein [Streptomyces griseocarneus]MBZ6476371.1 peptidase [Streptomyces griseocarneus]GHG77944.1 peptidase [Streptomyces griseocarneus]